MSTKQQRKTAKRKDRQAAVKARARLEAEARPYLHGYQAARMSRWSDTRLREAIQHGKRRIVPGWYPGGPQLDDVAALLNDPEGFGSHQAKQICEQEDAEILEKLLAGMDDRQKDTLLACCHAVEDGNPLSEHANAFFKEAFDRNLNRLLYGTPENPNG